MKGIIIFLAATLMAGAVQAKDRAYTLDGAVIELGDDGTYQKVVDDNPSGKFVFSIISGQSTGSSCSLQVSLQNNTTYTVQYLKQCFKLFTQRGGETVCVRFGGGGKGDQIGSQESVTTNADFKKGGCKAITGAEPYVFFNGRDPSEVNVDGLPPYDARRLFYFSNAGVLPVGN